jgi:hypothetical protein
MVTATPRSAFFALAPLLCLALAACDDKTSEPAAPKASAPAAPVPSAAPVDTGPPVLHRIVYADHRNVVPLRVGDGVVLPDEPQFDWRFDFEDKSAFTRVTDVDAGGEAYRVTKPTLLRIMVYADPKCMKVDSGCGLSKRRWDVTLAVK